MNIVIVGAGKIGKTLTSHLLEEGHSITLIDDNARLIEECINNYDVNGIVGNGASLEIQREANVKDSDLFIAVTSSDEINMISCIVARKLGTDRSIARVRNPEYSKQVYLMGEELGLSMVVNPEYETAMEIARLLRFPTALKIDSFANGKVNIVEIKIDKDSSLIGLSLKDVYKKYQARVLISCVNRNDDVIIPNGDFIINEGDEVYITSTQDELARFFKKINIYKEKSRSVMVIGGGRVAYHLAKLVEDEGFNLKIIERDVDRCYELSETLKNALIVNADGSEKAVLNQENFGKMDAVVTLTGFDEENMILSISAKKLGVPQVITKINHGAFIDIADDANLDCIITPSVITADHIVRYARGMNKRASSEFRTLYRFIDNKVEAVEFYVSNETRYTNVPLKDLELKQDILLAAIIRDNKVIIPNGLDMIMPRDTVVVFARATQITDLSDILR